MTSFNQIRKEISSLETDLEISKRDLKRYFKRLKDEFGIDVEEIDDIRDEVEQNLKRLKKKEEKIEKKIKRKMKEIEDERFRSLR
jgi:23S rRNA pseudoU1915 N3-methylase RlmH